MARTAESKNRAPRTPAKPMSWDSVKFSAVKPGEEMAARRPVRLGIRSAEQVATDKMVRSLHEAWVELGRPTTWDKMPGISITVPTVDVSAWKAQINNSGRYTSTKPLFSTLPGGGNTTIITFTVVDLATKESDKPDTADGQQVDATPDGEVPEVIKGVTG